MAHLTSNIGCHFGSKGNFPYPGFSVNKQCASSVECLVSGFLLTSINLPAPARSLYHQHTHYSNFNLGSIAPHYTRNHQTSNLPAPARSLYHQHTYCTACQRTKSIEHCTSATATYHPHLDLSCCTLTSTRLNWCTLHFTFGLRGKKHQQPRVSQAKTIALTLFISCKQQHISAATVTVTRIQISI
eukprot:g41598.t1